MNPDCTHIEIQLAEYAAGTVTAQEHRRVEAHLAGCAACRDELARELELRDLLTDMPTTPCPAEITEAIVTATKRPPVVLRWPAGLGLVAALLVFIITVPGMLSNYTATIDGESRDLTASRTFSAAEVAQARYDVMVTLTLAADILDRSSDRTMTDVFGRRLPRAVNNSLRNLDSASQEETVKPNPTTDGGKG